MPFPTRISFAWVRRWRTCAWSPLDQAWQSACHPTMALRHPPAPAYCRSPRGCKPWCPAAVPRPPTSRGGISSPRESPASRLTPPGLRAGREARGGRWGGRYGLGHAAARRRRWTGIDLFHGHARVGGGNAEQTGRHGSRRDGRTLHCRHLTAAGFSRCAATGGGRGRNLGWLRAGAGDCAVADRAADRPWCALVLRESRHRRRCGPASHAEVRKFWRRRLLHESFQGASMSDAKAREEICRIGASLFERGYVHATAGNISVRLDDGFLITPSDACLGFLDPARLARLDWNLQQRSGDRASKTIALHASIYKAATPFDAGTQCVIHTHSTPCVALTLQHTTPELLPALTPYFVMKVGHVPVIDYHRPGAPEAAEKVAQTIAHYGALGIPIHAVMLSRLGPNVWHDTPSAAMATLEELEETARLLQLAGPHAAPLESSHIEDLRRHFGARW